ncbi:restriction endonuclease subunit S [Aeromonas caviae]|uniref:restriction endonuclease subunit S n=1 Tax=Aeromonas caviae TaxID=648 RepID=UPI0038D0242B
MSKLERQPLVGKYKPYPEYKDSGVEWLGKIPSHWAIKKIAWYFKAQKGRNAQMLTKEFCGENPGDFPVYSGQTENDGVMGSINSYEFDSAQDGCLFATTVGAKAMTLSFLKGKFSLSQNCMVITPTSDVIDTRFYFYHCQPLFSYERGLIPEHMQASFRMEDLYQYQIAMPNLQEQQTIATFLDYETARIDRLIAQQQRLIELLKEKRQAVISHAVTKGLNPNAPMKDSGVEWLGQVPEHWVVTYNKYLVQLTPKKSQITLDREQLCSFIPMEKLKQDTLILDEQRVIGDVFDGYTYFEDEDILLAKVTPCFENKNSVVARGLINGVGFGSTEIFVLRCNSQINNDFMYYRLQEGCFMDTATAAMTGAGGLKRVPSDVILNYKIALPPIEEQLAIVKALKNQLDACDKLIERAFSAIALMQERRIALISAAVTGKIDLRGWTQPAEEVAA